jgi:Flp pilus assembly protein TadB
MDPIFAAALGATILLGGMLLRRLNTERRWARTEARLRALTTSETTTDTPHISLRKARPPRRALPMVFSSRLEAALSATGDRIGLAHLTATGIFSAAAIGLFAAVTELDAARFVALCSAGAAAGPAFLVRVLQSRYQRQFLDAFPDALDLTVRAVRAGLPVPEAMEVVSKEIRPPVGAEFRRLLDELRIGTAMEEALQRAADRVRVPDFRFFVVSLLLQGQTGGGIAETLSNLSTIIRQRKALRLKARALTAEAQASAAIVAATPLVAGVGLFLIDRELMRTLLIDPRGRFLLELAAMSLLSGVVSMKLLIKRNLS